MGYVAVQGGIEAIANADKLARFMRIRSCESPLSGKQVRNNLRYLVDRVMGEGSLYSPFHAALAIRQAEGDTLEASFILRAYRSTLPRIAVSVSAELCGAKILRRISSAFKDIPGGQILGGTNDYRQRILDFALDEETSRTIEKAVARYLEEIQPDISDRKAALLPEFPKVVELLQREGLVKNHEQTDEEPKIDITKDAVSFPLHRSGRLQIMARSETGSILALAYSSMRGYGSIHPTIAELRIIRVPLVIEHPYRTGETIFCGEVVLTEAEIIAKFEKDEESDGPVFTLGYGCCFGMNEVKAISMAVLDRTMKSGEITAPSEDQEFVLSHIDGIESSGFCAHFKLPHYITFQAELDRLREAREEVYADAEQI